mgnify:CR=1 FL=1
MNATPDTLTSIQAAARERGERGWYFMIFTDGPEHLGSAIVEAFGPADALLATATLNIDPGRGRVVMTPVAPQHLPAEAFRNRLLTKAEVASFWPEEPPAKEPE